MIFAEIKKRLIAYHSKVNWLVFCSIFTFTFGAWIDINGLWCELPIMVHELPEKWRLPSYLSISTQIAQLGPLIFLTGRHFFPNQFTFPRAIFIILSIGALSCFLLSFFWNKTAFIFGENRSIGLILLNFSLGILDGTSSVTFLPYVAGNFVKEYIIPNYIGESLSAVIPSALSLAQRLGQNPGCSNLTIFNETSKTYFTILVPNQIRPKYSVSTYFMLMFVLLAISTTSFSFLNFSKYAIKRRKLNAISSEKKATDLPDSSVSFKVNESNENDNNNEEDKNEYVEDPTINDPTLDPVRKNGIYNKLDSAAIKREKILLLGYIFILSFTCYGVLPGIQSYSTLPYGNHVFNYAVNLSYLFLPISIFLSIWSYNVSLIRITIEFSFAFACSVYIFILAKLSPCPPWMDSWVGPTLAILSWIFAQSLFMRSRCLIAARLERFGQTTLIILGILTMIGQIFGGLIVYFLVNVYTVFKSKPDCTTDNSYCFI